MPAGAACPCRSSQSSIRADGSMASPLSSDDRNRSFTRIVRVIGGEPADADDMPVADLPFCDVAPWNALAAQPQFADPVRHLKGNAAQIGDLDRMRAAHRIVNAG